jgi:hypothetical protein
VIALFTGSRTRLAALATLIAVASVPRIIPAAGPDFQRQVRPILVDKCFACHGQDEKHREGSLRLDLRESILKGGDTGVPAVVPGKPEGSELWLRVSTTDPTISMPPKSFKKPLTDAEREILRQWIEAGAEYQEHWAFRPPVKAAVPETMTKDWGHNEIDQFILSRLEREGLAPTAAADRVTLLRRLTLDLTGLPPTLEEIDAFVADKDPQAYGRVVTRLLASPHYGERWGRLWLDGARYADSDGYEKDKPRFVWAYRDWVVNALNRDLPYDQFIVEQVAGDLLPSPTQDQLVATGFLRNSMINEEGGVDPEQFRMEAMFDRMDAIGKNMLGLTIQCAQCHNHKYDPLTQVDYYRMFAFLNDTYESNAAVYPPDQLQLRAKVLGEIAEIEAHLKESTPDWLSKMAEWETSVASNQPEWTVVRPDLDTSGGQKHTVLEDGSILASGYAPTKHTTEFVVKSDLKGITAVRVELLNDPNLPLNGPGRSIYGTCALSEFKLDAGPAEDAGKMANVKIASGTADVNPPEAPLAETFDDRSKKNRVTGPLAYALDGKDETAWGIDIGPGRSNVPRNAVFVLEKPLEFSGETSLKFRLTQNHGGWNSDDNMNNNLGRFRLSVTTAKDAQADTVPAAVRRIFAIPAEQRSPAQIAAVFSHWRTTVGDWKDANERIEALWKLHPVGTSQLVLGSRGDDHRMTHLLERGDFLKPKDTVSAGTPKFLPALGSDQPTRLDFARWIVRRDSPTAARAAVNRVWQTYFGTGLTSTSDDFGLQSEAPSHPELLDWLAVQFMDGGWKLKDLHRLIVTSATYQQASDVDSDLLARDPQNRLLARGARYRMEAESVRDISLAVSGLLNPAMGGPSVYPPAPDFLFQPPASYGPKTWKEDHSGNRYRRALYTFRFRSVPYPMLQTFDAPTGDTGCVRRVRSNTPLQALATLNEPLSLEAARAFAQRILKSDRKSDEDRLAYAFRLCTAREPDSTEAETLTGLLTLQKDRFRLPDAKPWELAANDPAKPPELPEGTSPSDLAAWTAVSRVLLNLDETITRQ